MSEAKHTEQMQVSPAKIIATVHSGNPHTGPVRTEFFCVEKPGYFAGGGVALVRRSDDARLFASAPDLLAACKAIMNAETQKQHELAVREVEKAIAKAEVPS